MIGRSIPINTYRSFRMTNAKSMIALLMLINVGACSNTEPEPNDQAQAMAGDGSAMQTSGEGTEQAENSDADTMTDSSSDLESEYTCTGSDHPLVGSMAVLDTHHHEVAGSIYIEDNCTIKVSNFTYDGLGPSVYFYGGIDGMFKEEDGGFLIGEQLNGTPFNNEDFNIIMPDTRHLDKMNSISVWCADFAVSFGDGLFH